MKKLIAMTAIAACGATLAIESANIVGYATQDVSGENSVYNIAGFCFANVGLTTGEAKLSDYSATGWNWENDELRVLNPATCASAQRLVYLTREEAVAIFETEDALAGWYDSSSFDYMGDESFAMGSGFMTSLSSKGISFQYSGQVYNQAFSIDCANKVYVVIPNGTPRTIKMSEITATGWNWENDELRVLNSANCSSLQRLVYLSKEEAVAIFEDENALAGWYDSSSFEYMGEMTVEPGDGFMTSLSSKAIQIHMPAAIPAAE